MKRIILLLASAILTITSTAQTFEWAKRMGGADLQEGHSIAFDENGNVYTSGYFRGTADFDPGAGTFNLTSAGNNDVFISKLDASGNFIWAKQIGGTGFDECYSINVDANGNVYTTGRFEGTVDFDPGAGIFNLTSNGISDIYISKLDASGNFVWAKQFGGTNIDDGFGIALDASGSIYATGRFQQTVDFDPNLGTFNLTSAGNFDAFITKLDASGNFVWAKQQGGTDSDEGYSITLDGSGNVYTTGIFQGTADFDPGVAVFNLTSVGSNDIFTSKLDASGNFVWAKRLGGAGNDIARSIAVDNISNVHIAGAFTGTADFDPGLGTFNLISSGGFDAFITKLDASGNFTWANKIGGSADVQGFSMALDPSGNVYTIGDFRGSAGGGSFGYSSIGLSDIFIARLDAAGNYAWLQRIGGGSDDKGYAIAVDANWSIYTTGYFRLGADFDPGSGTFNLSSAGAEDIFVHKMSQCINTASTDNQTACYEYYWPLNGVTYFASTNTPTVTLVNAAGCDSIVTLNLTIFSPAEPIGAASQSFCSGATVADLSATGTGIQWYPTNLFGETPLSSGTALSNGATYYASQTGTNCEGALLAVTVTINAPAAPTGSAVQEFCNAATITDLTATGTDIQWYTAASGGSPLAVGTPLTNGATYYASQTVNGCESTSRFAVSVTINTTATPTGTASQTVCNGAVVSDLSATGSNIQWYAAASGGSPLAAGTTLINGTSYYASQTINGCESSSRLEVTVTINTPSAPTGSTSQTFCNSASVADLAATGTSVQWYDAASGGNVLSAGTALVDGTTYYATQTVGGCESTATLAVTATVNTPAAPTGTAAQEFCNAGTVADLTATGSGIQWYTAPSGGTALTSGTALSSGTYYASQTVSGCESTNRLAVTVTINTPAAPTGSATQTFCGSGLVSDLSATGSNITWYDAATSGNVVSGVTALVDGSTYYATQTINGCESVNALAVTATINAIPSSPTGATNQDFCNSGTIADLAASGTSVQWYDAASGGNVLSAGTALVDGTTYYATQTVGGCESTATLAVTATVIAPAVPSGSATQSFCNSATVADLAATGTAIQWYDLASGGTALSAGTSLSNGTYYASQTISGCEGDNRLAVTVTIEAPTAPAGAATQSICFTGTIDDLSVTGTNITWYDAATSGNTLSGSTTLIDGTTYYATQTVNGCESQTSIAVTATVVNFSNTVSVSGITLTADEAAATYQWVDCNNGNTAITGATAQSFAPTSNGSFAVEITLNGCTQTSACEAITTVGIEEFKTALLEAYPNPATDILTITTSLPTSAVITAANGAILETLELSGETKLDLRAYAPGIYFIRTQEGEVVKFIKE